MLETLFELIVIYNSERTKGFVDFEFYKFIQLYAEMIPDFSEKFKMQDKFTKIIMSDTAFRQP